MSFLVEQLAQHIGQFFDTKQGVTSSNTSPLPPVFEPPVKLTVALSGGMDSVVLLHGLRRLIDSNSNFTQPSIQPSTQTTAVEKGSIPPDSGAVNLKAKTNCTLSAIHINHQISANAEQWQKFCEDLCDQWRVPLQCHTVDVSSAVAAGNGIEAAARSARYEVFSQCLGEHDLLVMGHHQDDQLETLMLRLMRGASVSGLAAMPFARKVGKGSLLRPLLALPRKALADYAAAHKLQWVEDESNEETDYDRNFLRHEVLPRIAGRWPEYRSSWSKSLALLSESAELEEQLAIEDIGYCLADDGSLEMEKLVAMSSLRRRNVLKTWLAQIEFPSISWSLLTLLDKAIAAGSGSRVKQGDSSFYFFNGAVHAVRDQQFTPGVEAVTEEFYWNLSEQEFLLPENGRLINRLPKAVGESLKLEITYRPLLDRQHEEENQFIDSQFNDKLLIKLPGRPRKSVKKLIQESQCPPWLRRRLPVFVFAGKVVGVAGIGFSEEMQRQIPQIATAIEWIPPNFRYKFRALSSML